MENTGPLELDVDLSQVDTSFPVLVGGLKDLRVVGLARAENKAKTGFNLVVSFETTEPDTDLKGNTVLPGYKLTSYYPLQAKEGTAPDKVDGWKRNLAAFQDACLGTEQGTRPAKFIGDDYLNKIVRANVVAEPTEAGDRMQNSIKSVVHPK